MPPRARGLDDDLAFLAEASDDFARLSSAEEIMYTLGAKIGSHLDLSSCNFCEVNEPAGTITVMLSWRKCEADGLPASFRISDTFSDDVIERSRQGKASAIRDAAADTQLKGSDLRPPAIGALVAVPFRRRGAWKHCLIATSATPRDWQALDLQLLDELSSRIFPRIERARAEDALRASQEQYRSVMENMSEGLMLFDAAGNLVYQNPASLRIHGFDPDQEKLEREKVPATWKAWDASGRPITFEEWPVSRVFRLERFQDQILRVVRVETGKEFYGSYNGCPILDAEGRLRLGFITIRDITEQVLAQQAREKSERRLRALFDSEMMGALYWNMDGQITDANDKFLRMVGYTREELVSGKVSWIQMTPEEYRDADLYALYELRTMGVDTPYEKVYLRKDGTPLDILIGASMLDDQHYAGVAFVIDISARKRAEKALRESERQFRALAESVPQLVWTTTPDGEVDYVNERWCAYTGLSHEASVGRGWIAALHPDDRNAAWERWVHSARQGTLYEIEYRLSDAGGRYRWFLARGVALRDTEGRITRWFGTSTDIDENRRTVEALTVSQEQLRHAKDELDRANAELERKVEDRTARLRETVAELEHFSYTITHDMRAPLRAMQAFGQILREEYRESLDAMGADYLRRIVEAAHRMDNLITDSLNYARAMQTQLSLESVDPGSLIRGIVESYPQFQPPRADIHVAGNFPQVLANPAGLTQCVSNILGNAVKFVAPGRQPTVHVWPEEADSAVRIWFEDNGIGIPSGQHDRVFEMFHRLSKEFEGTGVGLALVRKVAEKMSGKVGHEPRPGGGTRFWLELKKPGSGTVSLG